MKSRASVWVSKGHKSAGTEERRRETAVSRKVGRPRGGGEEHPHGRESLGHTVVRPPLRAALYTTGKGRTASGTKVWTQVGKLKKNGLRALAAGRSHPVG